MAPKTLLRPLICLGLLVSAQVAPAQERTDEAQDRAAAHFAASARNRPATLALAAVSGRRVRATLRVHAHAPDLVAQRWQGFVARPSVAGGQSEVATRLVSAGRTSSPEVDGNALMRIDLTADPATRSDFDVEIEHRLRLVARSLVLRTAATEAVPALPADERTRSLRVEQYISWTDPIVQQWLDRDGLRPRVDEDDLTFARRAFLAVRGFAYHYAAAMDRHVARVVAERSGDCGGLCIALAAALRANGVPARLLAGRWATSALPGPRVDDVPYLQQHVKLEFHCQGIGWVPCDPASGVLHDRGEGLRFFASDPGDFIELHRGCDLTVITMFGPKRLEWLQGIAFWVRGDGSLDSMQTVENWEVVDE